MCYSFIYDTLFFMSSDPKQKLSNINLALKLSLRNKCLYFRHLYCVSRLFQQVIAPVCTSFLNGAETAGPWLAREAPLSTILKLVRLLLRVGERSPHCRDFNNGHLCFFAEVIPAVAMDVTSSCAQPSNVASFMNFILMVLIQQL